MATLKQKETINFKLIIAGLVIFFGIIFFVDLQPGKPEVTYTAAIAVLMAFWWISEALPIGVTSFLPILLFPLLGILDGKEISNAYINYVIFLFIGGFLMALAMEKWDLHKRIALKYFGKASSIYFQQYGHKHPKLSLVFLEIGNIYKSGKNYPKKGQPHGLIFN